MRTLRSALLVVAVLVPSTASAHPLHPGATPNTQSGSWVEVVMVAALGLFTLIIGGAMSLRLTMHRHRLPVSPRTQLLLTSTMAGCAAIALVSFVATQFITPVPLYP